MLASMLVLLREFFRVDHMIEMFQWVVWCILRHVEQVVIHQVLWTVCVQVMSVDMLEEQALAYKEAVTEYRALAMAARASKTSKATSTNILDCLARRQVSNIFTQLRKVWWCSTDMIVS